MALNTSIRGLQIRDAFFGAGLARNGSDGDIMDIQVDDSTIEINTDALQVKDDGITNDKLANMTQGTVKVGGASDAPTDLDAKTDGYILIGDGTDVNSVAVSGDVSITNAGVTTVTDLTISGETQGDLLYFDGANWVRLADGSADEVLTSDGAGGLSWTTKTSSDAVADTDIKFENESANCNGVTTVFTIDSSPIANSVQVYLNGLLQEEGSGKDYTISGTSITFATAPETNDILLIHYIAT